MVSEAFVPIEETLVIETPERVPLHFALASIGNRFLACVVDHTLQILTIILMYIAFVFIAGVSEGIEQNVMDAPKWVIALLIIILFLISSGYFIFFEWLWNG